MRLADSPSKIIDVVSQKGGAAKRAAAENLCKVMIQQTVAEGEGMNRISNNRRNIVSLLTVLLLAVLLSNTALLPVLAQESQEEPSAEQTTEQIEALPADTHAEQTDEETNEQAIETSDEQTIELSAQAANEPAEQKTYKRTILLYICGTDLETDGGMATYNLRQILKSSFSADDDVKFIIMTGGTNQWQLEKENLVFPDDVDVPDDAIAVMDPDTCTSDYYLDDSKGGISNVYNQIWEAKGIDAADNPGKMVLVDGDGVFGDGADAKRSMIRSEDYDLDEYEGFNFDKQGDYEWMNEPEVLEAFINFGVENYPAEKYDLILWDHGGGPSGGFCSNQQEPRHGFLYAMTIAELADAFANNKVVDVDGDGVQDGKFDFINFDACLMGGVEDLLAFSDYMDYFIASPETIPGYGQYYGPEEGQYTGWLDALGKNTDINTYELGKIIVDDFITFYDKESGDGSSQEGTLGIFDVNKLVTPDFINALTSLDDTFALELRAESYYDEFRAYKNAIVYAYDSYHDLGNLLTYLAFEYDDLDYQDFKDGNPNISSSYTDLAMYILNSIYDKNIVYARSTRGIHSQNTYYFDTYGEASYDELRYDELQYGEQPTSGLYTWFDLTEDPNDIFPTYHMYMNELIQQMKGKDPNDPRVNYFENHLRTAEYYAIATYTGRAVTDMITNEGVDPVDINYEMVHDYWNTHNDKITLAKLDELLSSLFESVGGEAEVRGWLEGLVNQMRSEAIQEDKAEAEAIDGGYIITLNDVRKQAVDNVRMNVYAELPALKDFLEDPAHADYVAPFKDKSPGVVIGTINGTEVIDIDPEDGYEKALDWLYDPTSTWTIGSPETKWFALRDAEGNLHVTAAEYDETEIDVPTAYMTMEPMPVYDESYTEILDYTLIETWNLVYLRFKYDDSGNPYLYGYAIAQPGGGYRLIEAKDYDGEYELYPAMEFGNWGQLVPISYEPFMLTADTAKDLTLEFMELDEIGVDVGDIDGDGKSSHSVVTAINIYGIQTDITDKLPKAEEGEFAPYVVKGDGQAWVKGSEENVSFTFKSDEDDDETFERFIGIQIDGKDVEPKDYTVAAGSDGGVVIDLSPAYLETLATGKHTVKVLFDGAEAEATFEIQDSGTPGGGGTPGGKEGDGKDSGNNSNNGNSGNNSSNSTNNSTTSGSKSTSSLPKTDDVTNVTLIKLLCGIGAISVVAAIVLRKQHSK